LQVTNDQLSYAAQFLRQLCEFSLESRSPSCCPLVQSVDCQRDVSAVFKQRLEQLVCLLPVFGSFRLAAAKRALPFRYGMRVKPKVI
jgi:hypothetical protein